MIHTKKWKYHKLVWLVIVMFSIILTWTLYVNGYIFFMLFAGYFVYYMITRYEI